MSQERWLKVTKLFEAALERSAEERETFVREVCQEDDELFLEVKKLLEADLEAGIFMEQPLIQVPGESHNEDEFGQQPSKKRRL